MKTTLFTILFLGTFAHAADPTFLKDHILTCGEKSDCPNAIVKIIGTESNKPDPETYQCTGFLVDKDVVATNRHCLPDDLLKKGISCAGRIYFQFSSGPSSSTGAATTPLSDFAQCDKVLSFAKPGQGKILENSDYAFLKLKLPTKITPFTTDSNGATDQEILTIWKVDGILKSTIVKDHCQVTTHTLFSPFSTTANSPLLALKDCNGKHGHSGSPLLNPNGEVVALFEGSSNEKSEEYFKTNLHLDSVQKVFRAPNFACICESEYHAASGKACTLPPECSFVHHDEDFLKDGNKILSQAIQREMQKFENSDLKSAIKKLSTGNTYLSWNSNLLYDAEYSDARVRDNSFHYGVVPKCIQNTETLIKLGTPMNEPTIDFDHYSLIPNGTDCSVELKLNPYLEVERTHLGKCNPASILVSFSAKNLEKNHKTKMRMSTLNEKQELIAWREQEISLCQP